MELIQSTNQNKDLKINDGMQSQYLVVYLLMFLTIVNSTLNIINEKIIVLWSIIGILTLIILIFYLTRLESKTIISLNKIDYFSSQKKFGRKRYFLKLKNGKKRFIQVNSLNDIQELYNLFESLGIHIKY